MNRRLGVVLCLSCLMMQQAVALPNQGERITYKQVGQLICLGGQLPEQGDAPVTVVAMLAEIAGQQYKIMVKQVVSEQTIAQGGVVLGETVYRKGDVKWVNITGWTPCPE